MKVQPCLIKLFFPDFKLLMCGFHVSAFIVAGAPSHHCNKLFLSFSLLIHVSVQEEGTYNRISKHKFIKLVHHSANSSFAS